MLVFPPIFFFFFGVGGGGGGGGGGGAGLPCLPLPTHMHADTTPCCSYMSIATFSGDAAASKKNNTAAFSGDDLYLKKD